PRDLATKRAPVLHHPQSSSRQRSVAAPTFLASPKFDHCRPPSSLRSDFPVDRLDPPSP
ncbi:hypothetical protein U1Q18_020871, partial [Sarracenia purpurea var. burkii]